MANLSALVKTPRKESCNIQKEALFQDLLTTFASEQRREERFTETMMIM
jgi:hypothetical protein